MKLFKNQEQSVFDEWIRLYHAVLYRHALWMTGSSDDATEIVQETFYQAWSHMHSLNNSEKALPWLLTILRRAVYREQRYQYRNRETIELLVNRDEFETDGGMYTLYDAYKLLEKLNYSQRETFLLATLHGFSYAEISAQLSVPIGTVMSRLSRAKEALHAMQNDTENKVVQFQVLKEGVKK